MTNELERSRRIDDSACVAGKANKYEDSIWREKRRLSVGRRWSLGFCIGYRSMIITGVFGHNNITWVNPLAIIGIP